MSIRRLTFLCATAALAALTCNEAARADLLIEVDKAAQRMTITVDGHEVYKWTEATGGIDYDTPNGVFKPFRGDRSPQRRMGQRADARFDLLHSDWQRSAWHIRAALARPCRVARLRAAVVGQCRDAMGAGEAPKDGQHDRYGDRRYSGREAVPGGDCRSKACEREHTVPSLPRGAGSFLPVPLARDAIVLICRLRRKEADWAS